MRHKLAALVAALALTLLAQMIAFPAMAQAPDTGVFVRSGTSSITSPVTNQTWLMDVADQVVKVWNGSAWIAKTPPFSNWVATRAPTVTDDGTAGFLPGSAWVDTTNHLAYICLNSATGAAVWQQVGGGSGGGDTITSPNNSITPGGTSTNSTVDLAGSGSATNGQAASKSGGSFGYFSVPTLLGSQTGVNWFGTTATGLPAFQTSAFPNSLVNFGSPAAIGSGTPAAGTFTNLTANTSLTMPASTVIPNGVTGTTQTLGDNTGKLATTAFVQAAVAGGGGTGVPFPSTGTNPLIMTNYEVPEGDFGTAFHNIGCLQGNPNCPTQGTLTAVHTLADGKWVNFQTAASSGSSAWLSSGANDTGAWALQQKIRYLCTVKTGPSSTDIQNCRILVGLSQDGSSAGAVTEFSHDDPGLNACIYFGYSTAVDGTAFWRYWNCAGDGPVNARTATAVAVTPDTEYTFEIDDSQGTTACPVKINGQLVGTITTLLFNSTDGADAIYLLEGIATLDGNAKNFKIKTNWTAGN